MFALLYHAIAGYSNYSDLKIFFKHHSIPTSTDSPDHMIPHNPLTLFSAQLLAAHLQSGNRYFVRQIYERGLQRTEQKITTSVEPSELHLPKEKLLKSAFLISEYAELSRAKIHMAAIEQDAQAYLYDAEDPEHLRRLQVASTQPSGFAIYAPLLAMRQWKPTDVLKAKIKAYIESRLKWKPRGSDEIGAELFLHFGELFITLKFGHDHAKVKLLEIEKD